MQTFEKILPSFCLHPARRLAGGHSAPGTRPDAWLESSCQPEQVGIFKQINLKMTNWIDLDSDWLDCWSVNIYVWICGCMDYINVNTCIELSLTETVMILTKWMVEYHTVNELQWEMNRIISQKIVSNCAEIHTLGAKEISLLSENMSLPHAEC